MTEPQAKELIRCRDCGKPVWWNGDCYQLVNDTSPHSVVCRNGAYHIAEYFEGEYEKRDHSEGDLTLKLPNLDRIRDESGYVEFTHTTKGWPGSGFETKTVRLKVRRVKQDNRDEAQLEILITELKGTRLYEKHGSIQLSGKDAEIFAAAILEPRAAEEAL